MNITIFNDYHALSAFAANEIISLLTSKPGALICFASGDSPKLTCELFVQSAHQNNVDTSHFFFVGLDEWVGVAPHISGSCHSDFQRRLFGPLSLSPNQYHLFDALSNDLPAECRSMDQVIASKGGIDLMIVGIGMNGHIGFNEPGTDPTLLSHVIELDATTVTVGQKYFQQPVTLRKGITLGLGHLAKAKKVLLLASGDRKASIVQQAIEGPIDTNVPASIIQSHPGSHVLIDKEAASKLSKSKSI